MKGGEARDDRLRIVSVARMGEGDSVISEKLVGWNNLDELPMFLQPFLPTGKPPEVLYHYTNAAGLEGILRNHALWATNYSFLNDPTEVSYGYEMVCEILKKRNQTESTLKNALEKSLSEVYTCSFSQCYDDLSQWRAYGGSSAAVERYCIGFKTEALYQASGPLPGDLAFQQVIYGKRKQRQILGKFIDRALTASKHKGNENFVTVLSRLIVCFLPRLKSHAFRAEEEWRLVHWAFPEEEAEKSCGDKICFDVSRGVVRPYVKIEFKQPPPVVELLVLAPGRERAAVKAANMLLRGYGISDVEAKHSEVPFVGY